MDAPETKDRLTLKQQKFVEEYLRNNGNAVEAARLAGYAGDYSTLGTTGHENLKNPKIAAEIQRRMKESMISADAVLKILADQATVNLDDFYDFGPGAPYLNLEKAKARGKLHLIKEFGYSTTGKLTIKFHDAQAAARDLGRYHKLFTDRVEHDFSKLADADLIRQAAGIVAGGVTPGTEPVAEDAIDDGAEVVPAAPPDDEAA